MKRSILIGSLVLATVLAVWSPEASAYSVVSGHPRLFFTASDLPELRAKCEGPMSDDYDDLRSYCDSQMGESLPLSAQTAEWQLGAYSFVYAISQDTSYASRAKQIAQSIVASRSTNSTHWIRGGALFFDWCYDYLTPSERQTFGEALASGGAWYHGTENWDWITCFHGLGERVRNFLYPGLAIYGEGIDDATAQLLCDEWHEQNYAPEGILCCADELAWDGSWFQGGYNFNAYLNQCKGFELWATATDENPYEVSENWSNLATYYLFETGPAKGGVGAGMLGSKQGDTHGHSTPTVTFRITLLNLARRYQDGHAQWLAEQIVEQDQGYINRFDRWRIIVATDLSVEPEPPDDLSGSWFFEGVGTVYMRSGFDLSASSDDVYAVFRCERMPDLHTHAHQNHLLLARGTDLLAIDSGTYDFSASSHHDNYFSRTIAHNSITVYDPNEDTFGGKVNDGGQRRPSHESYPRNCGELSEPQYDRGRMVAYQDSETFTYAKGDATAAYSADKVTEFTREIVYLKPDIFVVLDRVTATSASFPKRWLLHSIDEPEVQGSTTVIQEGGSKLFVRTLLPAQHEITTIGGPGREFEVNGTNYPPNDTPTGGAGSWRIEVTPEVNNEQHLFLHVLYAADASVSAMPDCQLIESDDVVGAEVGDHVVVFSRSGITIDSATYEYGG